MEQRTYSMCLLFRDRANRESCIYRSFVSRPDGEPRVTHLSVIYNVYAHVPMCVRTQTRHLNQNLNLTHIIAYPIGESIYVYIIYLHEHILYPILHIVQQNLPHITTNNPVDPILAT